MEPNDFLKVRGRRESILREQVYLTEYECHVDRTILYNGEYRLFTCIMRDVTEEMLQQEKKIKMRLIQELADCLKELGKTIRVNYF